MTTSYARVPKVAAAARREEAPTVSPPGLAPVSEALLERQQAARRARAEARSLTPAALARIEAREAAERAVEENLARGRALTRREVRKATDPARYGRDRASVRFPAFGCALCGPIRMVGYAMGAMAAPFALYFAIVALAVL